MADLTHLKLAHRLLTHDANLGKLERAERYARAQAYATLAVAEALDRIATVIEAEAANSTVIETYDGQQTVVPHRHYFPAPGVKCECGTEAPPSAGGLTFPERLH